MKLIIIGAGPGGYETAVEASRKGLDVTLITAGPLGGTCLNEGCIPTKCFCHDAHRYAGMFCGGETGRGAGEHCGGGHSDEIHSGCGADCPDEVLRKMVERKDSVVEQLRGGVETLLKGVEIVHGIARVADARTVRVWPTEAESAAADHLSPDFSEYREFSADRIIIATGSHPAWLNVPGAAETPGVLSSSDMLRLTSVPKRLTVIGGGVIGLEFASIFSSLGSKVTVIEYCKGLLPHFDADLAKRLKQSLTKSGITILTGTEVTGIAAGTEIGTGTEIVFYRAADKTGSVEPGKTGSAAADKTGSVVSDKVLMAVGRVPDLRVITGCRGIESGRKGIKVDENMQTTLPGVYAIGDANGQMMLAHAATAQGRIALNHILSTVPAPADAVQTSSDTSNSPHGTSHSPSGTSKFTSDTSDSAPGVPKIRLEIMPAAVFTVPEVATVGLTEEDCKSRGLACKALKSFYRANGKALAGEVPEGYCKILVAEPSSDSPSESSMRNQSDNQELPPLKPGQILGCHILGAGASDLISEVTALMNFNATVQDLRNIIHPHPTLSEILCSIK